MFVSGVQQNKPSTQVYISSPIQILFSCGLLDSIKKISLNYTVGASYLYVLYIVGCIC